MEKNFNTGYTKVSIYKSDYLKEKNFNTGYTKVTTSWRRTLIQDIQKCLPDGEEL